MKKLFSFFAAMLVAVAVNAQTDFATPYECAADDAVLSGAPVEKLALVEDADGNYIGWSDVGLSSYGDAKASWTITTTRGCYVTVSIDLGPIYPVGSSNKHIFEVKILDADSNVKGTLAEPAENADAAPQVQVKALSGTILIPAAGTYTVELQNKRDYGKGSVKGVILTYDSDAPAEIIEVTSVALNKNELALEVDEVEQLFATVLPEDAFDRSVTWVSYDNNIATVVDGFVTAVGEGTVTIAAQTEHLTASCAVTVSAATVPEVDFAEPLVLPAKKAHIEGAVWKMYDAQAETYKIYGDGGHNSTYGTASWTINVTKACIVSGKLLGLGKGALYELDLIDAEENVLGTIAQPTRKKWSSGEVEMDSINTTLTFPAAGTYTLQLRNTLAWSSGQASGIMLTFVEDVAPAIENGYYIVGSMNEWQVEAEYKMDLNEEVEEGVIEYMYNTIFAIGDEFKVVEYTDGNWSWHPNNDQNYIIDAKHAGATTVYFRPNGKQDDDAWFYTVIYVGQTSSTAISNTADEETITKRIENGQIVIIKNGVKFNTLGAVVK